MILDLKPMRLRISEIFYSIQGEARTIGCPTVFIRLTGCPLRCTYCDTTYAFQGGEWLTLEKILAQVRHYPTQYVTVTGGEPLAQKPCLNLLIQLANDNYQVSLETSGALDISAVDRRVSKVLDVKTPASGEAARNLYANFQYLTEHDQIKIVICNRSDYLWAKQILVDYQLERLCEVFFSPAYQQLSLETLATWILEDHLPVRLQTQLHKIIWRDVRGR